MQTEQKTHEFARSASDFSIDSPKINPNIKKIPKSIFFAYKMDDSPKSPIVVKELTRCNSFTSMSSDITKESEKEINHNLKHQHPSKSIFYIYKSAKNLDQHLDQNSLMNSLDFNPKDMSRCVSTFSMDLNNSTHEQNEQMAQ